MCHEVKLNILLHKVTKVKFPHNRIKKNVIQGIFSNFISPPNFTYFHFTKCFTKFKVSGVRKVSRNFVIIKMNVSKTTTKKHEFHNISGVFLRNLLLLTWINSVSLRQIFNFKCVAFGCSYVIFENIIFREVFQYPRHTRFDNV